MKLAISFDNLQWPFVRALLEWVLFLTTAIRELLYIFLHAGWKWTHSDSGQSGINLESVCLSLCPCSYLCTGLPSWQGLLSFSSSCFQFRSCLNPLRSMCWWSDCLWSTYMLSATAWSQSQFLLQLIHTLPALWQNSRGKVVSYLEQKCLHLQCVGVELSTGEKILNEY